jgi:phosphatidate phosphatase APP1
MSASHWVRRLEQAWDGARLRRARHRVPRDLRIEPYFGHGSDQGVVVRGRVLDDPEPSEAVAGEGVLDAVRRSVRQFLTDDLPGVPLRVTVAGTTVETVTDHDGYFQVRLNPEPDQLTSPWTTGSVGLAGTYRGVTDARTAPLEVSVPSRSRSSTGPSGKPRCRMNATRKLCRFQGLEET